MHKLGRSISVFKYHDNKCIENKMNQDKSKEEKQKKKQNKINSLSEKYILDNNIQIKLDEPSK